MRVSIALLVCLGCGNTVDFLGPQVATEGIGTVGSATGTSSAPGTAASTSTSTATSTSTSTATSTSTFTSTSTSMSSGGALCDQLCSKLDMVVVLDNTPGNAAVRNGFLANVDALAAVVADPARPWVGDFHLGFVPTAAAGVLAECRLPGAMSSTPNDGQPIPCISSSGGNFADHTDAALTLLMECFANVEPVGALAPHGPALATARALGQSVPGNPVTDDVIAQCNAGFLRDDSLKVAVIIAASDDIGSPGGPPDWAMWLSALPDLDPCSRLLVLAIVPDNAAACSPVAANVQTWVAAIEVGATSDWCAFRDTQGASGIQALGAALDEVCQ